VTITLPASGWLRTGVGSDPGYKYSDKRNVNGPITAVTIRSGKLKIRGKGAELYSLADAAYGSITVRVELGARHGFCATGAGRRSRRRRTTRPRIQRRAQHAAAAHCPPLP
jgi:hypothetical protein